MPDQSYIYDSAIYIWDYYYNDYSMVEAMRVCLLIGMNIGGFNELN